METTKKPKRLIDITKDLTVCDYNNTRRYKKMFVNIGLWTREVISPYKIYYTLTKKGNELSILFKELDMMFEKNDKKINTIKKRE